MFCRNCGKEMADGWAVCPHCGQAVGGQNPAAPANAGKAAKNGKKEGKKGLREKADKLGDKALNKLTGRNMETIRVPYTDLVNMVNMFFIKPATSEEELDAIRWSCSKNALQTVFGTRKKQMSKDNKYEIYYHVGKADIANVGPLSSNTVWVHDEESDIYYQIRKPSELKKFSKAIKQLVNERKATLNIAIVPDDNDEEDDDFAENVMDDITEDTGIADVSAADDVQADDDAEEEFANSEPQTTGTSGGKANYAELVELKNLLDMGIITEDEFAAKKKELLGL